MHLRLGRATALAIGLSITVDRTVYASDPAAAREQVKLGYTLAQSGNCEEAIPHFVESLRLDTKAVTLINLANCEEKTGQLTHALGHWVDARSAALAERNTAIVAEAERRAHTLEPRLAKLTILVPSQTSIGLEVTRDGMSVGTASFGVPLPVNPGPHTLVLHASEHEETRVAISLSEGESKVVELSIGAPKTPPVPVQVATTKKSSNALVYIGFGTAAAGLAVGAVTGLLAFGKASTANDACTNHTCGSEGLDAVEAGRTLGRVSNIAFLVGGIGAALGIVVLVMGETPGKSASYRASQGLGRGLGGTF
jgi:hypothetical protein